MFKLRPKSLSKSKPKPSPSLGSVANPAPILGMGVGCGFSVSAVLGLNLGLDVVSASCPPVPCFNPPKKSLEVIRAAEIASDGGWRDGLSLTDECFDDQLVGSLLGRSAFVQLVSLE
jgi:hypothetical protein